MAEAPAERVRAHRDGDHALVRADPPDLGRIEVQLNVDSSGRATSHLVVDRADTLDLLRRDAPALERALQSAGLTTDNGSLQFSLRDQSFAGRDQGTPAPLTPPTPATTEKQAEYQKLDEVLTFLKKRNAAQYALRSDKAITEASYVKIGGIEQWVTIRGADRDMGS